MAAKDHDKITPEGKQFFKQMKELKKLQVRVGYQGGKAQEDGVDLLDIAMWNELGTSRAPARPFIRNSVDMNVAVIDKFCKAQTKKVTQGGTAKQILSAIGTMQKGLIQDTISKSKTWAEPNAPLTVAQKGSDQPLVDTGRMAQSVDYVIIPQGSGD
jgi:hypothetical protein